MREDLFNTWAKSSNSKDESNEGTISNKLDDIKEEEKDLCRDSLSPNTLKKTGMGSSVRDRALT